MSYWSFAQQTETLLSLLLVSAGLSLAVANSRYGSALSLTHQLGHSIYPGGLLGPIPPLRILAKENDCLYH